MPRRLLLVRHGETDFNRERRTQGHLDVPLNDEGLAQARAIAHRLAGEPIGYCAASDLCRAADTAHEILRPHSIEPHLTPHLREAHLGILQGRYVHEHCALLGDDADYFSRLNVRSRPPGGESPLDVRLRVRRYLRELTAQEPALPAGDILIVAHGGSLRSLTALLLGLSPAAGWSFQFDNCSLSVFRWDPSGRTVLLGHNDCAHLSG